MAAAVAFWLALLPVVATTQGAPPVNPVAVDRPDAATAGAAPTAKSPDEIAIPALTDVVIVVDSLITTKTAKTGTEFPIHLADPIRLRGAEVVPAGTMGVGAIVHAATARSMGKAGELVLAARYLDFDGRHILLRSTQLGRRGKDNTDIGFAVAIVALPALFFITGGEVVVPAGTLASARTAALFVLPPGVAAIVPPAPTEGSIPASAAPPATGPAPH